MGEKTEIHPIKIASKNSNLFNNGWRKPPIPRFETRQKEDQRIDPKKERSPKGHKKLDARLFLEQHHKIAKIKIVEPHGRAYPSRIEFDWELEKIKEQHGAQILWFW